MGVMLHSHHLPELCYFYKKPSKTYVHFKTLKRKRKEKSKLSGNERM